MGRHPNKEIRDAVDYMIAAGWRVELAGGACMGSGLLSRCPRRMPAADIDLVDTAFAGDARQAATPAGPAVSPRAW